MNEPTVKVIFTEGTEITDAGKAVIEYDDSGAGVWYYPNGRNDGTYLLFPWHRIHRIEGQFR